MSQLKRTDIKELNVKALAVEMPDAETPDVETLFKKANSLTQDGQLEAALQHYDQVLAADSTAYLAFHQKGEILTRQNKRSEAIASYKKSISLNSNFPWSYNALGLLYIRTQEFEKAVSVFEAVVAIKPEQALFQSQLGNALVKSGRFAEAATALSQAVALDPSLPATQLHLGALANALDDYSKAIAHYKNAIALNPSPFWPYRAIADLSRKTQNHTQAIEYYHKALERKPSFANGYVELGKLYQGNGDTDRSLESFISALSIDPNCEMAHTALRYTPVSSAQLDRLILAYERIASSASHAHFLWGSLGDALSEKGDIPRAIYAYQTSGYQRAIQKRPELTMPDAHTQKKLGPDYIIIGAAKCGTTSLHKYIGMHPDVFLPHKKEINFFNHDRDKGIDWYLAHFPAITDSPHYITGESSPGYFYHPGVDQDIHAVFPNVKLIVLLRDPVDRAISWYYHNVQRSLESRPLRSILELELKELQRSQPADCATLDGHIGESLYAYKLQRWLSSFSQEQCLILKSEDFYQNTPKVMSKVFEFLNLPPFDLPNYKRHNVGSYRKGNLQEREMLKSILRPHNQKLNEYLNRDFGWNR